MKKKQATLLLGLVLLVIAIISLTAARTEPEQPAKLVEFNEQRAFQDVEYQVSLGPRIPGSQAHSQAVDWMVAELKKAGWKTEIQETERMGHPVRNVIARLGEGRPWTVLGAHYDSRLASDRDADPLNQMMPTPGANDGASGVAVLLELARVLPSRLAFAGADNVRAQQVWLVFFDVEDNGNIPGWDWILGSRAFAESLTEKPDAAIVIDMIGDSDLRIPMEGYSDPAMAAEIWGQAQKLGYEDIFVPERGSNILDDHVPFLEAGIPAVDIIDIKYPYWHTLEDTPDKVSPHSLKAVGETLLAWLLQKN